MRLYPSVPGPLRRTVALDVLALLLLALFAWLGFKVHDVVAELNALSRGVVGAGTSVQDTLRQAGDAVGATPIVGGSLRDSLQDAGRGAGGAVIEAGRPRRGGRRLGRRPARAADLGDPLPARARPLRARPGPPGLAPDRGRAHAARPLARARAPRRPARGLRAALRRPPAPHARPAGRPRGGPLRAARRRRARGRRPAPAGDDTRAPPGAETHLLPSTVEEMPLGPSRGSRCIRTGSARRVRPPTVSVRCPSCASSSPSPRSPPRCSSRPPRRRR